MTLRLVWLTLCCWCLSGTSLADGALHCLWELHGKHNTVYVLGSIHVLRSTDYPLAPAVLQAYGNAKSLVMEIDMDQVGREAAQEQLLAGAMLGDGKSLADILGPKRYSHAMSLAHELGLDLSTFDQFAPWFVAEAISQLQLLQLGFQPQSGVEMYFLERAHGDGKSVAGLETVQDQISLFQSLPMATQADYLISSLEQAHELPQQVGDMVLAWQRGDTQWFERQMQTEFGRDPALYESFLSARNRKWIPKIKALLNDDKNYLVIVGTGHLVGRDSVINLLKRDGVGATQL